MKAYFKLTKSGIVWFVLLTAFLGYATSVARGREWDSATFTLLMVGLYLVSSGSFSWNQAQEWKLDSLMPRTQSRPIPSGVYQPWQAYLLGFVMVAMGTILLLVVQPITAILSFATVVLYNGLYTLYWKKKWSFGAVPGAIPGAMPGVIGYSAVHGEFWNPEVFYLFMIMFLWQMPHFWCLAIKFKDDYARANIPVLPLTVGVERTLYHMGLYMFAYIGLAIGAPWFLNTHVFYLLLILPIAAKVIWEFFKYHQAGGRERWLPFFLWVNLSMLVFLAAPVLDAWLSVWFSRAVYNL